MTTYSKSLRSVFTYKNLVYAIAGSLGSVIAMSTFYPLDTIRFRLQLNNLPAGHDNHNTLQLLWFLTTKEGLAALYTGLFPVLQSLCISNFIYFYTFHCLKSTRSQKAGQSVIRDLIFGMLAGVVNVLTTTPCWVVNTRLKLKSTHNVSNVPFSNLLDGISYVARTEGYQGLWAGTVPSLMLVINPAIQFMVYEALKRNCLAYYKSINSLGYFGIGAMAKAVATVLTYPLQLVQTRLRHGGDAKHHDTALPKNAGTIQMILYELNKNGMKGLYRGIEAKLLQTVLTAALMFMTYEKISRFVITLLRANRT